MKVLGIDGGIASVGWAMIELDGENGQILGAGTWMFDTPETDKDRKLKSAIRREKRGMRRVIKRRRQRMNDIRTLLAAEGLLPDASKHALAHRENHHPWALRVEGLDHKLTAVEFAVVLGHMARHRGFKSNAKNAASNTAGEDGKVNAALSKNTERLARYASVAEMIVKDDLYAGRCRNRNGDYSRSIKRDDIEAETRLLFKQQRKLGNTFASEELCEAFCRVAFFQRPLQDSEDKVGMCALEPKERRAATHSWSFERFRFLSRLANLTLVEGREERRLTSNEIALALKDFGAVAKVSFASLRKKIGLPSQCRFATIKPEEETRDVVARTGEAASGSAVLRKAVGETLWASLIKTPEQLDQIAFILSFREDKDSIRKGLVESAIDPLVVEAIMLALDSGKPRLDSFSKAGHISAKAARAMIPHLAQGLVYSEAAQAAGYTHTDSTERHTLGTTSRGKAALAEIIRGEKISPELVGSPVARKALLEAVKQVKAVIETYGMPDTVHIELARDVGKSIDERHKIETGIDKRNKERDRLRKEFTDLLGREPGKNTDEMMRYELWKEQNCRCLYTDQEISPHDLISGDNSIQVDHILPWSRFGDDSYANKTLCVAHANQAKKGRTPYEWLGTTEEWDKYVARVEQLRIKGIKKRNYVLKDGSDEVAAKFRSRNLNDTRWATRLLAEALRSMYAPEKEGEPRRVFARPGAITNRLRQGWGLQWLKKDAQNNRLSDDRHHALDAIITAATTESMLQRLTKAFQASENRGDPRHFRALDQPWPGFREQALTVVENVFVARAERRRARGEAHQATIRQIRTIDGKERVFERKPVAGLTLEHLKRIKNPERNQATIAALAAWIAEGKPADRPPLSPKGDPIAKVSLLTDTKIALTLRGGAADRGDMAGVDVFQKKNKAGKFEFYMVPLYPHQIARLDSPPEQFIITGKDEAEWGKITPEFEFLFRMSSHCWIRIVKKDGEVIEGYFKGTDRSNGNISLATDAYDLSNIRRSIGIKTLLSFQKFQIDRLGNSQEIHKEVRTWRGKACI